MKQHHTQPMNEKIIECISLKDLKQLILDMKPSGKINDISTIRLFLLGIVAKLEGQKIRDIPRPLE